MLMKLSRESDKEENANYTGESEDSRSLHVLVMPCLLNALSKVHHRQSDPVIPNQLFNQIRFQEKISIEVCRYKVKNFWPTCSYKASNKSHAEEIMMMTLSLLSLIKKGK